MLSEEQTEIIEKYISSFPYLSKDKTARLILEKEKEKFPTINNHRHFREVMTKHLSEKVLKHFEEQGNVKWNVPDSLYQEYEQEILPTSLNNILILSDMHIPFYCRRSIQAAIKHGEERGINCIILNGDIIDFYGLSRFVKDKKLRSVKRELDMAKEFLGYLREKFPNVEIYFKTGNHEDRWKHYLWNNADDISDLKELELETVLRIKEKRIKFIDDKRPIKAGKLFILHGHELFLSGAVNVARTIRLKTNENTLFGHFHKTQDDFTTTLSNKTIGSFSTGALCGLHPLYMPINNWNNGFARIEIIQDGNFCVHNKKILNGEIR